ncbi:chorismate mutase [Kitasatospora sp. NPDC050543]|uniref:chorismate mutase n=1 Tax=Kitasatospora sp. NPDC050543 TaxID=3364054 RepID=UPI0037B40DD1
MSGLHPRVGELRVRIDALDEQIVRLLAERYEIVREVARFKPDAAAVRAPDRVGEVIGRVRAQAERHGLPPALAERCYRLLIEEFTALELARQAEPQR